MVNVSRKYLESDLKRKAWQKLRKEISGNRNLQEIFKKFFTPCELVMIEKRLLILLLLEEGWSYLSIRHLLDVSPGTISFIKQGFKINKRTPKLSFNLIPKTVKTRRIRRRFPTYKGRGRWQFLDNL